MPRPRFQNLDKEKQKAILDAAAEEFAAQGLEGASYNKIIEKAGISKGAMYYYFDDKQDLFSAVLWDRVEPVFDVFSQFPPVRSPEQFWEALSDTLTNLQEMVIKDPISLGIFRIVMNLRYSPSPSPLVEELIRRSRVMSEHFIMEGQRVGAVRTDLPLEFLMRLTSALDEMGDKWLAEHCSSLESKEIKYWADVTMDLIRRVLSPDLKSLCHSNSLKYK